MAKRKEAKEENKKGFGASTELFGLIIILISVIGIGRFGPVGNLIGSFAIFLSGTLYNFLLFLLLITGVYMLLKRKLPEFGHVRLVGLYILLIAVLALAHNNYIKTSGSIGGILGDTINQMVAAFKQGPGSDLHVGGGFVGALIGIVLYKLFANGNIVVLSVLLLFGLIMLFNISLGDLVRHIVHFFKMIGKMFKKKPKKVVEDEPSSDETKDDRKVVSDLSSYKQDLGSSKEEDLVHSPLEEVIGHQNIYTLPPLNLLNLPKGDQSKLNHGYVKSNIEIFKKIFNDFEIGGKVVEVHIGPSVTQYEIELKSGTKVNRLLGINREIALALAAKDVRIQAPIPGKNTVGIEIPNRINTPVTLREVLAEVPDNSTYGKLLVGLGKDIMGKSIFCEINKTPHLLVAGATGSGKSVCINTIIASILMRNRPDEVKLLLIDPKKVELSLYNGVPHLLSPVVTDPRKASLALMKIVSEMESRYNLFTETRTKNIESYNEYIEKRNKETSDNMEKMPYIVVIIDELADLMIVAAKEVEDSIMRITQMARASGIHLIVATQRPSTDVVTGIIKANIPSRISFAVSSNVDSRTILDMGGAEKLLGKGDMLFLPMGENTPVRVQGSFIHEEELKRLIDFTVKQQKARYDHKLLEIETREAPPETDEEYEDPLYNEVVDFAVKIGKISASLIQRKYRLGYNRAARIIDLLEERGVVGPSNGSKPREVLVKLEDNERD